MGRHQFVYPVIQLDTLASAHLFVPSSNTHLLSAYYVPGTSTVRMALKSSHSLMEETDMAWALSYVMGPVPQVVSVKDKPREKALDVGGGL